MRMPVRPLHGHEFDRRLENGDRRQGVLIYTPECPNCQACEPIRLDLEKFRPGKTHRRILRCGDRNLRMSVDSPAVDQKHFELYKRHLFGRGLSRRSDDSISLITLRYFLSNTSVQTFAMRLYFDDDLVAVAVTDYGETSFSAHYTFYDPSYSALSLGTYAILKQAWMAQELGYRYLYLGLYVEQNAHMRYKARFHPHQRRISGRWVDFDG